MLWSKMIGASAGVAIIAILFTWLLSLGIVKLENALLDHKTSWTHFNQFYYMTQIQNWVATIVIGTFAGLGFALWRSHQESMNRRRESLTQIQGARQDLDRAYQRLLENLDDQHIEDAKNALDKMKNAVGSGIWPEEETLLLEDIRNYQNTIREDPHNGDLIKTRQRTLADRLNNLKKEVA